MRSTPSTGVLETTLERISSLFLLILQAYAHPSHLLFGDLVIPSEEGLQQRDPLAPALFCFVTQPIIADLKFQLNAAYLDDESIADEAAVVPADIQEVLSRSSAIGLKLNPAKCELYVLDNTDRESLAQIESLLPGSQTLESRELELLGAPLTDETLSAALEKKVAQIRRLAERLPLLKSHAALYMLKNCLSIPKLVYLLRCVPSWKAPTGLLQYRYARSLGVNYELFPG